MGRRIETIPAAVMDALVRYPWPGNIREMQNVIERAVILSPARRCKSPPATARSPRPGSAAGPAGAAVTLADAEREHILGALRETGWVLGGPKGAAARLGMKRIHASVQDEEARHLLPGSPACSAPPAPAAGPACPLRLSPPSFEESPLPRPFRPPF